MPRLDAAPLRYFIWNERGRNRRREGGTDGEIRKKRDRWSELEGYIPTCLFFLQCDDWLVAVIILSR